MDIKDKIRHIKYMRLEPINRCIIDLVKRVDVGTTPDSPNSVFYGIDGYIIFEHCFVRNRFLVKKDIWATLHNKYVKLDSELKNLFRESLCIYLNIESNTLETINYFVDDVVWYNHRNITWTTQE